MGTEVSTTNPDEPDGGVAEPINSHAYWNVRFKENWRERGGSEQTAFFYRNMLEYMPGWLTLIARRQVWTICDWGCALGEGSDILSQAFPGPVTGIDFSEAAVADAQATFSRPHFISVDLLTEPYDRRFNMVVSSNTLEHFSEPKKVLDRLASIASDALVIMVPFREYQRHEEHESTFDLMTIPVEVGDAKLVLASSRIIPTSKMQPTHWWGDQILLIYLTPALLAREAIRLVDMIVDRGEMGSAEGQSLSLERSRADLMGQRVNELAQEKLAMANSVETLNAELKAIRDQFAESEARREETAALLRARTEELDGERSDAMTIREKLRDADTSRESLADDLRATQAQVRDLIEREKHYLNSESSRQSLLDQFQRTHAQLLEAIQEKLHHSEASRQDVEAQLLEANERERRLIEEKVKEREAIADSDSERDFLKRRLIVCESRMSAIAGELSLARERRSATS